MSAKILHVVGARPNFMKIGPVIAALDELRTTGTKRIEFTQLLVHTGQHYDHRMSMLFFEQLALPRPDINLEVGSGSHGQQTGSIMQTFERILLQERPDLVVVVGDVNSTMACAIDAKKLGIQVAHIEAGLRSRDLTMPEEINRLVTDAISDLLFTTDREADKNLRQEGRPTENVHFVGNVMIDTLMKHRAAAMALPTLDTLGLKTKKGHVHEYAALTLHRPGNVDSREVLAGIAEALCAIGRDMPIVFPVHPRTRARIDEFGLAEMFRERLGVRLVEPMGYLEFLNLMANAKVVLTDSGGIQEETTILGVACLTLRPNTERPITVTQGTNQLVGNDPKAIMAGFENVVSGRYIIRNKVPELWDGIAAKRIANILIDHLN